MDDEDKTPVSRPLSAEILQVLLNLGEKGATLEELSKLPPLDSYSESGIAEELYALRHAGLAVSKLRDGTRNRRYFHKDAAKMRRQK